MTRNRPNEPPLNDDAPRSVDEHGLPCDEWRCRAKSKQTHNRCGHWREPGMRVCHYHGGRSTGPLSSGGRWSRSLGKFARAYKEAHDDTDLLDLRRCIATLDTLSQRHAERLEERDTPEFRRRALHLYDSAQQAQREGDAQTAAMHLSNLGRLLREGSAEDRAMNSLEVSVDRLSKRIEGAWGVKLAKRQAINAHDLTAVLARLVNLLREELQPADATRVIQRIDRTLLQAPTTGRLRTSPPTISARDHIDGDD